MGIQILIGKQICVLESQSISIYDLERNTSSNNGKIGQLRGHFLSSSAICFPSSAHRQQIKDTFRPLRCAQRQIKWNSNYARSWWHWFACWLVVEVQWLFHSFNFLIVADLAAAAAIQRGFSKNHAKLSPLASVSLARSLNSRHSLEREFLMWLGISTLASANFCARLAHACDAN